jgi:hypothetical protein
LGTILSNVNSIYTLPPYFCKIHFNIILPSICIYSEWCYMPYPSHNS